MESNLIHNPSIILLYVIIITAKCSIGERLDLTHSYNSDSLYWPNSQAAFTLNVWAKGMTSGGFWFQGDDIRTGTHVGTHMDAPCHFKKDAWCVGDIPFANLVGPGVFIDIRSKATKTPDNNLTLQDVQTWEADYGEIPKRSVIFMCSGWSDFYPNRTKVYGSDSNDTTTFHFPGFDVDAVKWLVEERDIVGIGSDTPSTEWARSTQFPVHVYMASKNVYGLENVRGTCDAPPSGSTVYVFPMLIEGASGAATRIAAIWDTDTSTSGCVSSLDGSVKLAWLSAFLIVKMMVFL